MPVKLSFNMQLKNIWW